MRVELLILLPESESYCTSKKSFIDFLKVDSLISVSGQKISYKKSSKSKEVVSAKFRVDMDLVKSKEERYFILALEATESSQVDEFNELCDRVRLITEKLSPGKTTINTLWDDVGRIYAERSYPLINEVENLMRRLIAKFMLITVGVNWSKAAIHPDLFKKIDSYNEKDPYANDLFKLDFIHLRDVLFGKKRDITLDELDRVLSKTKFSAEDQESIKKYLPKSNWEKYFSSVIEEDETSIATKWALLYELRNKVAHNRHVKKSEYEKIIGLCGKLKTIISSAAGKLGEIDINEEDRDLIIYSYNSDSPVATAFLSEKAVASHFMKEGYAVSPVSSMGRDGIDLIASSNGINIGIDVKFVRGDHFLPILRTIVRHQSEQLTQTIEAAGLSKCYVIFLVRDGEWEVTREKIHRRLISLEISIDFRIEFKIGRLDDEFNLTAIEDVLLAHNL